ncbi:MAG: hypothetical protein Q9217_000170 [Psora testacea]
MTIDAPRSLDIRAGHHPFTIASWGDKEGITTIDLLIEPRKGFTQKLLARAEYYMERTGRDKTLQGPSSTAVDYLESQQTYPDHVEEYRESLEEGAENMTQSKFGYKCYEGEPQTSDFRLAIFSGPHGTVISVGDYGKVLMIAAGSGIAAQLPYLKELVRGFNNYQVRTREIRLVWQLQSLDDRRPASELVDRILKEDTNTNGYIFRIEVYYNSGSLARDPMTVGKHGRLTYKKGTMDLSNLLDDQLIPQEADGKETMLVTVSANEQVRDELRNLVHSRLDTTKLLELDYQPAEKRRVWKSMWKRKTGV